MRFTTAAVGVVGVAGVATAAAELLSRDPPAHAGMTYVLTLAAVDSLARGSSRVGRASAVAEAGDGRAASGAVTVVGGGVAAPARFASSANAAVDVAAVAVAAVEVLSRGPPAHGGITYARTLATLDSLARGSS